MIFMPKWLQDAVFYEIYPQSFYDSNGDGIGDIQGIIQKLDYITELGCNAIWLNPVYDSPFMDAGYDVRDYKKVAPRYGTNEDLVQLFSEAHSRGIKILLDLVPGHTSDTHPWFQEAKKAAESEYSNRYIFTKTVWDAPPEYRMMCGICERNGNYMVNYFSSQPALNYTTALTKSHTPSGSYPATTPTVLKPLRQSRISSASGLTRARTASALTWLIRLLRTTTQSTPRQKSGAESAICSTLSIPRRR